jgi:predicted 3-demethylubiquinone-9 3-methyltransferase (glyoxalase superfamily)
MATLRQKITPFLWFDKQAEEAANHYISIFKNGQMLEVARYSKAGPGKEGDVMMVRFELFGLQFLALNAGPQFKFTEAISMAVDCHSQEEVDELWTKLSEGGAPSACGWLKDKYGLSWQITPTRLIELIQSDDRDVSARVMASMMTMTKIDIAEIEKAAKG